jgi:hypothetical protein
MDDCYEHKTNDKSLSSYIWQRPNFPTHKQPWYVPTEHAEIGKNGNKMNPLLFAFIWYVPPTTTIVLGIEFLLCAGRILWELPTKRTAMQQRKMTSTGDRLSIPRAITLRTRTCHAKHISSMWGILTRYHLPNKGRNRAIYQWWHTFHEWVNMHFYCTTALSKSACHCETSLFFSIF